MFRRLLASAFLAVVVSLSCVGVAFADDAMGLRAGDVSTQAAAANSSPGMQVLSVGSTYSSYDITGDGKADKIKLKPLETSTSYGQKIYRGLTVYVNGKKALAIGKDKFDTSMDGATIRLLTLKSGKKLLGVESMMNNRCDLLDRVYIYKSGKLALAKDLHKLMDPKANTYLYSYGLRSPRITGVSGSQVTVECLFTQSMIGCGSFNVPLKLSDGKLVIAKKTVPISVNYSYGKSSLKARTTIQAYKGANSSAKAFKVTKGKAVKIDKIYLNGKTSRLHVKVGSKSGWIKFVKNVPYPSYDSTYSKFWNKYFSNLTVAG